MKLLYIPLIVIVMIDANPTLQNKQPLRTPHESLRKNEIESVLMEHLHVSPSPSFTLPAKAPSSIPSQGFFANGEVLRTLFSNQAARRANAGISAHWRRGEEGDDGDG